MAWQQRTIADLEKEIEVRISRLEAKIAEHQQWLAKREDFAAKAGTGLVQLIAGMNPDAAALQVTEMEDEMAAALVMKLEPRVAAPLMAEVQPAKAARISVLIAGAAALNGRREVADAAVRPQKQQHQDGGAK